MTTLTISLLISAGIAILLIGIGYGKSKTLADKIRLTVTLGSIGFPAAFLCYIVGLWKFIDLGGKSQSIYQLSILWDFLAEFLLCASVVICFAAWKKGGFKKLNPPKDDGLLRLLPIFAFIVGPIFGTIIGLAIMKMFNPGRMVTFIGGFAFGLAMTFLLWLLIEIGDEFGTKTSDEEPETTDDTETTAETIPTETDDTETADKPEPEATDEDEQS